MMTCITASWRNNSGEADALGVSGGGSVVLMSCTFLHRESPGRYCDRGSSFRFVSAARSQGSALGVVDVAARACCVEPDGASQVGAGQVVDGHRY